MYSSFFAENDDANPLLNHLTGLIYHHTSRWLYLMCEQTRKVFPIFLSSSSLTTQLFDLLIVLSATIFPFNVFRLLEQERQIALAYSHSFLYIKETREKKENIADRAQFTRLRNKLL